MIGPVSPASSVISGQYDGLVTACPWGSWRLAPMLRPNWPGFPLPWIAC